jgi:hypothetical protein
MVCGGVGALRRSFLAHCFALLCGYEALSGHGYQAALGGAALDVLADKFGVTTECFASPFNCRWPSFCSALPLLDTPFGSLGSFFTFSPTTGSFECNPPFVPEVMSAMLRHIEDLLERAEGATDGAVAAGAAGPKGTKTVFSTAEDSDSSDDGAMSDGDDGAAPAEAGVSFDEGCLSFVVVIPHWPAVAAWLKLSESRFRRGGFDVEAAEHSYVDGAQHLRGRAHFRPSSFGTTVAVLQTSKAAKRWPWTETAAKELRAAMAHTGGAGGALLSEDANNSRANGRAGASTLTLQEWENRGKARGGPGGGKGKGKGKGKGAGKGKGQVHDTGSRKGNASRAE